MCGVLPLVAGRGPERSGAAPSRRPTVAAVTCPPRPVRSEPPVLDTGQDEQSVQRPAGPETARQVQQPCSTGAHHTRGGGRV